MKTTTVNLSDEQYEFLHKNNLKISWITQEAITKLMENNIKNAVQVLLEDNYITPQEYKRIIDDFEERADGSLDEITFRELKRERRQRYDLYLRARKVALKLKEDVEWIDIQLGDKKPKDKHVYQLKNSAGGKD